MVCSLQRRRRMALKVARSDVDHDRNRGTAGIIWSCGRVGVTVSEDEAFDALCQAWEEKRNRQGVAA